MAVKQSKTQAIKGSTSSKKLKAVKEEDSSDEEYKDPQLAMKHRVSHRSLPVYSPLQQINYTPELDQSTYKPRDLLNYVVKTFYSREASDLNDRQRDVKDKLIRALNAQQDHYGVIREDDISIARLQREIRTFMQYLDGYFFLGSLQPHVTLMADMGLVVTEDTVTGEVMDSSTEIVENRKADGNDGAEEGEEANEDIQLRIQINLGQGRAIYTLDHILGLLVSELAHCWFLLFGCKCDMCTKDALNTTGPPDHHRGPLFLMLHRLIITDLRTWDDALRHLEADDCPDNEVSIRWRAFQRSAWADLSKLEKTELKKRRGLSGNATHLIRLLEDNTVSVKPSLKYNQLDYEDSRREKLRVEAHKRERNEERRRRDRERLGDQERHDEVLNREEEARRARRSVTPQDAE
ncbi:hypothetical protein F5Y18DRAFT_430788 [Xylariaceae sp. FL1019]|nr:hypothetical protein F5Y18DRAFT_430788 [Xylariaceae sp. FL1019]